VSADGADWIAAVVAERGPNAVRCADPFHVVKRATDALDEVRRVAWNTARGAVTQRRAGRATGIARALKNARYALWKNPENLTDRQQTKLAWVAKTDPRLHRAYLLKEGLRLVFQLDPDEAPEALEAWIRWARRCRIGAFVDLQRKIVKHRPSILAAIEHGLSNGRIESVNTKSPTHHPHRVRVRVTRRTHRPHHAQPRRPPTRPPRPELTHGSVRRASFSIVRR
jgi:transposase